MLEYRQTRLLLIAFVALCIAGSGSLFAQSDDEYGDELILPNDEQAVNVVQKKKYLKKKKLELAPRVGMIVNDNYLRVMPIGASAGFYFTEYVALELEGYMVQTQVTSFTKMLQNDFKVKPQYNEQKFYGVGSLNWTPLYGKMSFLAGTIIPYDMFLTLGGGMVSSATGSYPLGAFGLGQRFFITDWLVFRFDLKFNYVREKIQQLDQTTGKPTSPSGAALPLTPNNKLDFGAFGGLSFFFPSF